MIRLAAAGEAYFSGRLIWPVTSAIAVRRRASEGTRPDAVSVGDALGFAATITNTGGEAARLSIDYIVHHPKANGESTGKTFKLAVRTFSLGEQIIISRSHSFCVITARRYYPGAHAIELLINGVSTGRRDFDLSFA